MIMIYGNSNCTWCEKAKQLAEQYELKYEYKSIKDPENLRDLVALIPNATTIPQIIWDNRIIGGYMDFAAEIENTIGGFGDGKI